MPTLLDGPLVADSLRSLPGWHGDQREIWREVHLAPRLVERLRRQVGEDAAAMGLQPVVEPVKGGTRYALSTPEVGGVSELDIAFASHISDLTHQLADDEPGVEAVRDDEPEVALGPQSEGLDLHVQPEQVKSQVRF